mgnify:CR=1 FL=1
MDGNKTCFPGIGEGSMKNRSFPGAFGGGVWGFLLTAGLTGGKSCSEDGKEEERAQLLTWTSFFPFICHF